MRRTLLGLTLVVGVLFMLGAGASPALAGNCTTGSIGPIVYDGSWYYTADLSGCTGVTGARFLGAGHTPAGYTIIYDLTHTTIHYPYTPTQTFTNTSSEYVATIHYSIWGNGCGWPPFNVNVYFGFNIRSGSTWGPDHQVGQGPRPLC